MNFQRNLEFFVIIFAIRYPPLQTLVVLFDSTRCTHLLSNSHDDLHSVRDVLDDLDGDTLRDGGVVAHGLDNEQPPLYQPALLLQLGI